MRAHYEREGREGQQRENPKLCSSAVIATPSSPRWRSARNGSARVVACSARGVDGSRNAVTTNANAISADTPKKRSTPRDRPENAADERADGDAQTQRRRLVENDRLCDRSPRRADDGGQRGGDEQRVAQPPKCPPTNDFQNGVGRSGQAGAGDEHHQPQQQRALRPDPARDHTGDEHRHTHHRLVAGEPQRHL